MMKYPYEIAQCLLFETDESLSLKGYAYIWDGSCDVLPGFRKMQTHHDKSMIVSPAFYG